MNLVQAFTSPVFQLLKEVVAVRKERSFVVGGFVRDYLLGVACKDIDIVVEGKGIDLARDFARRIGSREVHVFENFGTAMVRYREYEIEFVGARRESYQRNSRKPIVEEGSLLDDQLRRDFTINALSISLNEADFGQLLDPFSGLEDLRNKIIRTPTNPDITFSDDPLRMLRAIRFATRLGFSIEEKTYLSIIKNKTRLEIISGERIAEELNKTIQTLKPSEGFKLLLSTGLLEIFFPELVAMKGVDVREGHAHKDNFYHTLKVLDNVAEKSDNLWLRWVAILHDIAKPLTKRFEEGHGWTFHSHEDRGARMVPTIFRRLKLPMNEKMKYVQKLVQLHQRPVALASGENISDAAIRRIIVDAGEDLDDLLTFCRCDITSKDEGKVKRILNNYDQLALRIKEVEQRDNLRNWQPPVTGEMIMEAFNLPPSRLVGSIKEAVREAILEGIIPNEKEQALAYMHQVAPQYLAKK